MKINERHNAAYARLLKAVMKKKPGTKQKEKIGQSLGVTGQTVINYISGNCKDGYLTEAIAEEVEKL